MVDLGNNLKCKTIIIKKIIKKMLMKMLVRVSESQVLFISLLF